ncbi:MAG: site-specific integrase [Gammaproteobacteria bacterium]|nr:site-specific integrase [Gammaproteobacteria bacterium]
MGRKITPGLRKRGDVWHIEKQIFGQRLRGSTGTSSLQEAESFLAQRVEELRQATLHGVRPKRVFKEAAIKFLTEKQHKRSIKGDALLIKQLIPFIGNLTLDQIHMGTLKPFIAARKKEGVKSRTINHGLKVVRHLLNLAANEWCDERGLSWIAQAPKIKLEPELDGREPYPLAWDEQHRFFAELPQHLKDMALFAVNSGCRDQEICHLRWDWQVRVLELPELLVFLVPKEFVKNGRERLVVCNDTARAVVEAQRGKHPESVFIYKGKPIQRMLNNGWRRARKRTELKVRVHDLKHTFGRRLRAAGVSFEDRQDLLGHKSHKITTHYSSPELYNLYQAANRVCEQNEKAVKLTLLKCIDRPQTQPMNRGAWVERQLSIPTKSPQRAF